MRSLRIRAALALVLAAILLAAGLAVASADSEESVELTASITTTLRPGYNYVGWVGGPLSVAKLKREIPEVASVRAWDALLQRSYEPVNLVPGMGVRVTLSGDHIVEWRRPMTPVRSKVELQLGRNLVAWLGPDDWPIERVVQGIGRALMRATWRGGTFVPSLRQSTDSAPLVKRGDALWIKVSRPVNWLQPASVMPTIEFAGDASPELQAEVRRDSLDVMNHYAREFGIQIDGSTVTVYVAEDVEALIVHFEYDADEAERLRTSWYGAGGWTDGSTVVLKLEQWKPEWHGNEHGDYGDHKYGRYVIAHEYYHVVQHQSSEGFNAAQWLLEGGASWAEEGLRRHDAESTYADVLSGQRSQMTSHDAPPLDHTERSVDTWHYALGALASDRLAERSGGDAPVEFWRSLRPRNLGPLGRWRSVPPWQAVFNQVFGLPVDDFYADFAAWRSGLSPTALAGDVIGPDGHGLPFIQVLARSERLAEDQYDYLETYTGADGSFIFAIPEGGRFQLGVDLGGCKVYHGVGGNIIGTGWHDANMLTMPHTGSEGIQIRLSGEHCVWQIRGALLDAEGNPLGDVNVNANDRSGSNANARTDADGSFSITMPSAGSYGLQVSLNGCPIYYSPGGMTTNRNDASEIRISDADVTGLRFQLPAGACSTMISGRVLDAEGNGIANVSVHAQIDGGSSTGRQTGADGSFSITLPQAGSYRVFARINGCSVYYKRGGAVARQEEATQIRVSDADVIGLRFQLPAGACSTRISGVLLDAEGNPLGNASVNAHDGTGRNANGWTDADGSFSITLPEAGSYRVSARINGCSVYYRLGVATTSRSDASEIRISDADVTGLRFQLAAGACSTKISGLVLDAEGNGIASAWVHAQIDGGSSTGHQTSADGSFSITLPEAGVVPA